MPCGYLCPAGMGDDSMDGGGRVVSGTTTEVDGVGNTPSRATYDRFGLLPSRDIRASMHIRTVAEEARAEDQESNFYTDPELSFE